MTEPQAPGYVMQRADRQVWVRAEDRVEWERSGFAVVNETGRAAPVETEAPPVSTDPPAEDLSKLTVAQLKERAATAEIEGSASMKKAELIAAIEAAEQPAAPPDDQPAAAADPSNSWPTGPSQA